MNTSGERVHFICDRSDPAVYRYFSKGTQPPQIRAAPGQPQLAESSGIGIVLERRDADNIFVKRIAPDGAAAQDGRLQVCVLNAGAVGHARRC